MSDQPVPLSTYDEPTKAEDAEYLPPRPSLPPRFGPGVTVGHYELIRQLGQGGMGEVYLARDTRLGRRVALKFLLQVDRQHSARFLVEARATAQLTQENIVALYDIAEHDGLPYMVLEYVPGITLSVWMRNRRDTHPTRGIPPIRAAELMLPVARALQCAHDAGIVHRDLKPGNIMLTENGTVKVLDFGVAKRLGENGAVDITENPAIEAKKAALGALTEAGAFVGTRWYMAPEQWLGESVDGRTDIWAVGVMLYQMVTGDHPFAPPSPDPLDSVAIRDKPMPSIREKMGDIGRLGTVIDRCLIKYTEDRLGSARELVEQLEAVVRPHRMTSEDETEDTNPYAGLAAFQEQDAARFFGRETMVEQITSRLVDQPLLALVGASGAGKSSLVRAGVIPALRRGGDAWESFIMRPGPKPLLALADVLHQHSWQRSSHTANAPPSTQGESVNMTAILRKLRSEPGYLGVQVRARAKRRREKALLFIDQFEEIYTLASEEEREAFLQCLVGVADDPSSPVRVIVSIRHDFLDRVAFGSSIFADLMSRGTVLVGPLDRRGLQRALVAPAEALSYRFESESLVAEMLDTLEKTAGALPLLQFTAARLWAGRDIDRRMLTTASYRAFGGVEGALTSHADSVISSMIETEKQWARVLILRLVTPERTRAIATGQELSEIGGAEKVPVERVLDKLVDARLLVVESTRGGGSTVELVHESLIERWPRLSQWLDEADDDVQFRNRLRTAAKEWEAGGHSEGLVWRGDAAAETRRFWKTHGAWGEERQGRLAGPNIQPSDRIAAELNARETAFVQAVLEIDDRERRFRRRAIASGFVFLAVIVIVVSSLALQSRREARRALAGELEAQAQRNEARAQKAEAERNAARARNVTRMAAARQLSNDPVMMLALLREIEKETTPAGWRELAPRALAANDLADMVFFHDDTRAIAWSPDSRRIATGSNDKTVRIWNLDGTGEPIVYRRHTNGIFAIAWSPDGQRIASASSDQTVHVWNADGAGEPIVFKGHDAAVRVVAWHPDGKRLFTGAVNKTMGIWNIDGTGSVVPIDIDHGYAHTSAWSPDREWVVTGGKDGKVRLWKMDRKDEPVLLDEHDGPVNTIQWTPDGQHIVAAADDGVVQIWKGGGTGKALVLNGYKAMKVAVTISPDGRRVAFGGDTQAFKIANIDGSGHPIEFRTGSQMFELAFSPDGQRIASIERNGTIHVWNVERILKTRVFHGHTDGVYGAAWSPDAKRIASVSHDNTLRIWDALDGSVPPVIFKYAAPLNNVSWSPDGRRIAASAYDRTIAIWNTDEPEKPQILRGHDELVHAVAFSPDGSLLASCGSDYTVRLWKSDGTPLPTIFRHASIVYTVAFSPDGKRIVSSSKDTTARIWNIDGSGEPIVLSHDIGLYGAAFGPDGKYIVTGAQDRIMRLWNADGSGKPIEFKGHTSVVTLRGDRVFSLDGKRIVSSSDDGTTAVWNADGSGEPLFLRSSDAPVNMAAFSPDGKQVITASDDMNLTLWNDLDPITSPEDSRLWTASRYCMSLDLRRKWLDFPEEQSAADLARCEKGVREQPR